MINCRIFRLYSEVFYYQKFIIENQNMVQLQVIMSRHKESHVPKDNSMPKDENKLEENKEKR